MQVLSLYIFVKLHFVNSKIKHSVFLDQMLFRQSTRSVLTLQSNCLSADPPPAYYIRNSVFVLAMDKRVLRATAATSAVWLTVPYIFKVSNLYSTAFKSWAWFIQNSRKVTGSLHDSGTWKQKLK